MQVKNNYIKTWLLLSITILSLIIIFYSFFLYSSEDTDHDSFFSAQGSLYDAEKEINAALKKLEIQREESFVIKEIDTDENIIAITFDGITDKQTMEGILSLLSDYDSKATFFVPAIKSAENPSILRSILDAQQEIGNYTLSELRQMELLSEEELVIDFSRSRVVLEDITGKSIDLLKCNGTKYTDELLEVANACKIYGVVETTYFFNHKSFSSYEETLDFIRGIKKGSILSIKVDDYLDLLEFETTRKKAMAIMEKMSPTEKKTKDETPAIKNFSSPKDRLLLVTEWILQALEEKGYTTEFTKDLPAYHQESSVKTKNESPINEGFISNQSPNYTLSHYEKLRSDNGGEHAEIVYHLYTTQPAISYIFRGISNKPTVDSVLETLDAINAKATFFVTGKEILSYPETVAAIVSKGHGLGNGGYGMNISNPSTLSYNEIAYEIEMGERILKAFLGEKYDSSNKYYMPLYADTKGFVLEAASAQGYSKVILYNRNPMLSSYKDLNSKSIIDKYYQNIVALHRGDIVHFRLDYLTQPKAIENLIFETAEKFIKVSDYVIVPVDQLMTSTLVYEPKPRDLCTVNNLIKPTYDYDTSILNNLVFNNYIGNPAINTTETLIGFNSEKIENIDITGRIDTQGEKIIFLTFDDWGSDIIITRLLAVLDKYDVKASFFIRVGNKNLAYENDMLNPNLLRAIALEGHDIANHTFTHMKTNIETDEEKKLLQKDIVTAHREMERYVGDTGALKPFFRPPTLAISKLGLHTIFDTGYSYVVNGDFSSQDYRASSLEFLVDRLKNGINITDWESTVTPDTPARHIRRIEPGSIIVMHMSDESQYTPDALDIVIPYYMNQGYRFEKLSNYLSDDYHSNPLN